MLYYIYLFWFGAMLYQIVEMLWSGHSHWSMFILGGLCVVLVNLIYSNVTAPAGLLVSCLMGGAVITTMEYLCGSLVNLRLGWNVWDYRKKKHNCRGQICLLYSFFWVLLSPVAIFFGRSLSHLF